MLRQKFAKAHAHLDSMIASQGTVQPMATSNLLNYVYQYPEQYYYYCGPAMVKSIVHGMPSGTRQTISESTAAQHLGTTTDGTDWYNGSGYPVQDTLNYYDDGHWYYAPVAVSYSATAADKSNYRAALVSGIDNGWPIAANAWEVPGGPHLVGHPVSLEIFHWFPVRGYSSSGTYTRYADPVHNSPISWASGVPAYSSMPSDKIARILGGRGYIW